MSCPVEGASSVVSLSFDGPRHAPAVGSGRLQPCIGWTAMTSPRSFTFNVQDYQPQQCLNTYWQAVVSYSPSSSSWCVLRKADYDLYVKELDRPLQQVNWLSETKTQLGLIWLVQSPREKDIAIR